jgi:hypothetical protein
MTDKSSKPARKILVIGGSSYNENTLEKIGQALIDSNFLDEWAVIIAIHKLLKLNAKKKSPNNNAVPYKDISLAQEIIPYIKDRLSLYGTLKSDIICITQPGQIRVETGNIYVLPHSLPEPLASLVENLQVSPKQKKISPDKKYVLKVWPIDGCLETSFIDDNDQLKIHAEGSINSEKSQQWFLNNPYDASGIKRIMTAHDHLYGDPKTLPNRNESNKVFKLKLKDKPPKTVLYQDMPCIDKFMSEVAASTSQPTIAALLLCGLYGDGAKGLKEIKNKGGYTAVQFPDECCKKELKEKANATASMPATALQIENSHEVITLEDKPDYPKLSEWLSKIK